MDLEIYLCRHGETAWTIAGRHTGLSEVSLTEQGKVQATLLGKRLKEIPFKTVLCSPRKRAIETCALAGFGGALRELEPDAQEWNYGSYEGKTSAEILQLNRTWILFMDGAPHGETLSDVSTRADRLLQKVSKFQGPVAIFSHGHFSRVLAARWLGLDVQAGRFFYLSVGSMSMLGFEHKRPVIKLWNSIL